MNFNCNPAKILYSNKLQRRGLNSIGAGKYGQVYAGCTKLSCRYKIAVKMSRDDMSHEYKMLKKAYKIAPHHVPRPYHFVDCRRGSVIYYEFIKSKTLASYKKIDKNILYQVLSTLYKFQKYGIKHNDLHLDNILIEDGTHRAIITDYGFANTNDTSLSATYGVDPRSDPKYDYHLFLNSIINSLTVSSVRAFILKMIPSEYLGRETSKVKNFRLRYGVKYPGLPSLSQILRSDYFKNVVKYK
jgi:RIO-like serine/threonine protein kinase